MKKTPQTNKSKNKYNFIKSANIAKVSTYLFLTSLILPPLANAQTSAWSGVCVYDNDPEVATLAGIQCMVANVLSISLTLLGITGFIMILIGAFRWLISGGNSQQVEKARGTMTWAVAGIVLALSSFIILNIISEFTGVKTIMNFVIPNSNTDWR